MAQEIKDNMLESKENLDDTFGNLIQCSTKKINIKQLLYFYQMYGPELLRMIEQSLNCRNDVQVDKDTPISALSELPIEVADALYKNGIFHYYLKYNACPSWVNGIGNKYFTARIKNGEKLTFYLVVQTYHGCSISSMDRFKNKNGLKIENGYAGDGIYCNTNSNDPLKLFVLFRDNGMLDLTSINFDLITNDPNIAPQIKISPLGIFLIKNKRKAQSDDEANITETIEGINESFNIEDFLKKTESELVEPNSDSIMADFKPSEEEVKIPKRKKKKMMFADIKPEELNHFMSLNQV